MQFKKVLWGLMLISTALLLVGIGVFAYFSDAEAATANTFTAGILNLQVGSADPCVETISVSALVPGSTGNAATWAVQNTGNIAGDLKVVTGAVTNSENTCSEVEAGAGDTTAGVAQGELGGNLKLALWMDVDGNNAWSTGDYYLKSDETTVAYVSGSTVPTAAYATIDSFASKTWDPVQSNVPNGNMGNFRVEYDLPAATTSVVQSDSSVFDITFTLTQHT